MSDMFLISGLGRLFVAELRHVGPVGRHEGGPEPQRLRGRGRRRQEGHGSSRRSQKKNS